MWSPAQVSPLGAIGAHDLYLGRLFHFGGRATTVVIGAGLLAAAAQLTAACDECSLPGGGGPGSGGAGGGNTTVPTGVCGGGAGAGYVCASPAGLYAAAIVFLALPAAWWVTDLAYYRFYRHEPARLRSNRVRLIFESYFLALSWGPLGIHRLQLFDLSFAQVVYMVTLGGAGCMWLFDLASMPLLVLRALVLSRRVQDVVLRDTHAARAAIAEQYDGDTLPPSHRPRLRPSGRLVGPLAFARLSWKEPGLEVVVAEIATGDRLFHEPALLAPAIERCLGP